MRLHQRLIDVKDLSSSTIDRLMTLDLPAGVDVEVRSTSACTAVDCRLRCHIVSSPQCRPNVQQGCIALRACTRAATPACRHSLSAGSPSMSGQLVEAFTQRPTEWDVSGVSPCFVTHHCLVQVKL